MGPFIDMSYLPLGGGTSPYVSAQLSPVSLPASVFLHRRSRSAPLCQEEDVASLPSHRVPFAAEFVRQTAAFCRSAAHGDKDQTGHAVQIHNPPALEARIYI